MTVQDDAAFHLNQACEQVGKFLFYFGLLEKAMNRLLGQALDLDDVQTSIIGLSVPFWKKVEVIQAAIRAQDRDDAWKDRAIASLEKISDPNKDRNIAAHSSFESNMSGGVVFNYTAIKKHKVLSPGKVEWSNADFENKFSNMDVITKKVEIIRGDMVPVFHYLVADSLDLMSVTMSSPDLKEVEN